jgi:hypothetical protein
MTSTPNPNELFTPFLPTTYNIPEDYERLQIFLDDNLSDISNVVNDKMIGAFTQDVENFSGAKFSYDTPKKIRNGYQSIVRITSFIPQTIPLLIKNINSQFVMSLVYGTANLPCTKVGANDGIYFSFFSQGDARIQFTVSDTQIIITTNGTTASYQGFIILNYVRDGI